ncbi:FxLYD domain-containing protein [Nitrosopumilus sp.]|uniref:FxLYD domain-containing protein n=1 Tax=Nitrosopumilus sp. TaxID=2024843 RepID=UPI003D0CDCB2
MMNLKISSLFAIAVILLAISLQSSAFANTSEASVFPDWVRQSISLWIDGQISDSEFLALVQNVLDKNILPDEIESQEILKNTAKTVIQDIPELYEEKTSELIPYWVKDRAEWWIDGKISDLQFLRTIHYLREVGYLEYNPEQSIFSNDETFQSSLEKYLLDDKEILNIIKETKWRLFSTEYEFEEKESVVDSVRITFNDITRVYEPIFYKFKVPTLTMQIIEFNNKNDLDNYWNSFENKDKVFESAYLSGNPNENSECLFNYTSEGALTSCIYENFIIHVIIFDQHNEHYNYDTSNLILDENEPTTRFMNEILKKLAFYKNDYVNSQLYDVLQGDIQENTLQDFSNPIQTVPKSIEPEKSAIQGVENFSCVRDDFGLVTISGQYHNDHLKRSQVELTISFLDAKGNVVGKTSTTFTDLQEFESKRFVGHSKWNEYFHSCNIEVK